MSALPANRIHSPASQRNKAPILEVLRRVLPLQGRLLEIAAGNGIHAAHFAQHLPQWQWQPSDPDPAALASISAWAAEADAPGLLSPLQLDVIQQPWPVQGRFDALFNANMLHISPWASCAALMRGAAAHLTDDGQLITYGPYLVDGEPVAAGNAAFDADLRARNPAWGIRWLHEVAAQAGHHGLQLAERVAMPANNLVLVFRRQ